MNKRQRKKAEKTRIAQPINVPILYQEPETKQQIASRYFVQQIDDIRACSKAKVM